MKEVKIGEEVCYQFSTAEDMNIKRFTNIKEYMLYKETGVSVPKLVHAFQGFRDGFDNNSKSEMLISIYDYLTGISHVKEGEDPDQMVYAIITLDEKEDRINFDVDYAKKKLQRWAENGLTQRRVEEEVGNFIQASKAHFITFFQRNSQEM